MMRRPAIVVTMVLALAACTKRELPPYAVEEATLAQVANDLALGKTTSVAVTKAYLERIKTYDGRLHAVIAVVPDALDQAAASDRRRREGKTLGPLDGVPILVKDNIDVVGVATTAGSFALEANLPVKDSEVARRLKAAGAVIIAKGNTGQFAGFRATTGIQGSTTGGTPHNPYELSRSAAGSSNGPGIGAAVSFAAATVGSDTTGSIISPASYNGVVGVRPTVALISRRGIVPISATQDTAGPMARNITDAAMLLTALAGSDPADPASKDADQHKLDYVKALDAGALKGKRIGVLRGTREYGGATRPVYEAALQVLAAQGAELVDIPTDILEDLSQEDRVVLTHEFKDDLNAYLATTPATVKVRTLADLIAFSKSDPRESMHATDLFEAAEATNGRADEAYKAVLDFVKRKAGPEGYERALKQFHVDALVSVSRGPAELIAPEGHAGSSPVGEHAKGEAPPSTSMYAAIAGYPDISVPMGVVDGLPVGLSFIGPPWSESQLLSFAYAYEQAAHKRVPPTAYKNVPTQ